MQPRIRIPPMRSRKHRRTHTNRIQTRRRQPHARPRPLVVIESRFHLDFADAGPVRFRDGKLELIHDALGVELADDVVVVELVDGAAAVGEAGVFA